MKYRKIPVVVEAIQWNGENIKEVKEFAGSKALIHYQYTAITPDQPNIILVLQTLEGDMIASKNDYIIRGVDNDIYACKPWVFEQTYEVVNE